MNPIITLLIYGGIPLLVVAVIAAITLGGSRRSTPRYRPGRRFDVAPVWFLASPDSPTQHLNPSPERPQVAAERESERTTLGGRKVPELAAPTTHDGEKGGARGSW